MVCYSYVKDRMSCMKNKLLPLTFIGLLVLAFIPFLQNAINDYKTIQLENRLKNDCYNNQNGFELESEHCNYIINYQHPKIDTLTIFNQSISSIIFDIFIYVAPLFIMLCSIWTIIKEYQSGFFKKYLIRLNYPTYLKKTLLTAYKSAFILPIIMIFLFGISYFLAGHFDYTAAINLGYSTFKIDNLSHPFIFMFSFILNKFFFSLFYINLGLLFMYKNRNILVAILESYLFFIAIEIINEVLISSLLFYKILHISIGYNLYILDCYSDAGINTLVYLGISFLYAFISFVVLYFVYKNKEKTIIQSELLKESD